jgi:hypothetical protein
MNNKLINLITSNDLEAEAVILFLTVAGPAIGIVIWLFMRHIGILKERIELIKDKGHQETNNDTKKSGPKKRKDKNNLPFLCGVCGSKTTIVNTHSYNRHVSNFFTGETKFVETPKITLKCSACDWVKTINTPNPIR